MSLYDAPIDTWLRAFPKHMFCIISNDFLRFKAPSALQLVGQFAGLSEHDWTSVGVKYVHDHGAKPSLPISDPVQQRMRAFFQRHGSLYYDHVAEHGFWGCRPDFSGEM